MTIESNIDEMVLKTQEWLNRNYVTKYGYTPIEENGHTGWDTIIALTTALQIELGITEPTGNFGPQTSSSFKSLSIESNPADGDSSAEAYSIQNQIYIIQGALWCKGYSPGGFTGYFGEETKNAIIQMQTDAGLSNPDGIVDVLIMKALLSMDAFKLLEYLDTVDPKIREIQQSLNRDYISNLHFQNDLGLIPCDGLYGRKTNQALVYALQIEEGISEPTGYFGPATKENIPYLTLGTENKFVTLLQYSLYCNGKEFDPTGFTGYYGEGTQAAVLKFQEFTYLEQSGNAGLQTWCSLLISTGDDTRKGTACDCSTTLTTEKANTLKENGYTVVGRYLTGKYALSNDEFQIIINSGLNLIPIFEVYGYEAEWFNYNNGVSDATSAIISAKNLGIPENSIIYFAVDYDAVDYDVTNLIIPYFKGIYDQFNSMNSKYKIGIYAPRNVCIRISNIGYSCSSFVCDMSTGFSGNLGYPLPKDWAFDQISTLILGADLGQIEIDNNIMNLRDPGVSFIDLNISLTALELIKALVTFAKIYIGSNSSISETNRAILDYLRQYKYNDKEWKMILGNLHDFIGYMNLYQSDFNSIILKYIKKENSELININNNLVDLPHLAATILGYTIDDKSIIRWGISKAVPDFWTGWGGDLSTAMADISKMKRYTYKDEAEESIAENYVIAKSEIESSFSKIDFDADIDAINFANVYNDFIFDKFFEAYYNTVNSKLRKETILIKDLDFSNISDLTLNYITIAISSLMEGTSGFGYPITGRLLLEKSTYYDEIEDEYVNPTITVRNAAYKAFAKYIFNL